MTETAVEAIERNGRQGTDELACEGLVKVYGKRRVVNEVSMSVNRGEIVGRRHRELLWVLVPVAGVADVAIGAGRGRRLPASDVPFGARVRRRRGA